MSILDWLTEQVVFLTKRVYVLETELAKNGMRGPRKNAEALNAKRTEVILDRWRAGGDIETVRLKDDIREAIENAERTGTSGQAHS